MQCKSVSWVTIDMLLILFIFYCLAVTLWQDLVDEEGQWLIDVGAAFKWGHFYFLSSYCDYSLCFVGHGIFACLMFTLLFPKIARLAKMSLYLHVGGPFSWTHVLLCLSDHPYPSIVAAQGLQPFSSFFYLLLLPKQVLFSLLHIMTQHRYDWFMFCCPQ